MSRGRIVLALLALGAFVAAGTWLALRDPDVPGDGAASSRAAEAPAAGSAAAPGGRPAAPGRAGRWAPQGDGSLAGVVVEHGTGRPVAGVEILLVPGRPGPPETLSATSTDDGSFEFAEAPAHDGWTLRAKPPAPYADADLARVAVRAGVRTDAGTLALLPAFAVPGIVVDERGAPVAGADVRAVRRSSRVAAGDVIRVLAEIGSAPAAADTAVSGDDGTFRLTRVVPGLWDVVAASDTQGRGLAEAVEVTPASEREVLRVVLLRGFALEGRVRSRDGGDVAGVRITAFPEPSKLAVPGTGRVVSETDATGAFRISGLAGGRHVVAAVRSDGATTLADRVDVPAAGPLLLEVGGDAWIEGTVTAPGAVPVAGARVLAVQESSKSFAAAVTDTAGRYAVRGLAAGDAAVLVTADGFAPHPEDLAQALRRERRLELSEGINVIDVALTRGVVVTGTVVDRATGAPVAGAEVEVVSSGAQVSAARSSTTDARGRFELRGVPRKPAVLAVSKQGWCQADATAALVANAAHPAVLAPEEGDETLERRLEMVRAPVVRGRVLRPDGSPAPGALAEFDVELLLRSKREMPALVAAGGSCRADAGGRFELSAPAVSVDLPLLATATGFLEGRGSVHVEAGAEPPEVVLQLREGAAVAGRVTGADGAAVEGALVRWRTKGMPRNAEAGHAPAATGPDGAYRLDAVEPGELTVLVDHPAFLPWSETRAGVAAGMRLTVDAALAVGEGLSGTVLAPDGRPVAGAAVDVRPSGRRTGAPAPVRQTTTAEDGTWRVEGLAPGAHVATASAAGYLPGDPVETNAGAAGVTVRLAASYALAGVVRVRGGGGVAGITVRASLPRPAPAATVPGRPGGRIASTSRSFTARTDGDGAFRFPSLPAGTYALRAQADADRDGTRANVLPAAVEGVEAGREDVILEVGAGAVVAGTVFLPDRSPATSGRVDARRVRQPGESRDEADSGRATLQDGRFEVVGLRPGSYTLTVSVPGFPQGAATAETGAPGVRVDLAAGGVVRGRVVLPGGVPARRAWVSVSGPGGGDTADEEGRFEIRGVPAGVVRVSASVRTEAGRHTAAVSNVVVREAETTDVPEITLAPGRELRW